MRFSCILAMLFFAAGTSSALPSDFSQDLESFQENNVLMEARKGKLKAAEDSHLSKQLFWTPTLSLSAGKTRDEIQGATTSETEYRAANASINLFKGGSDWARLNQAAASEQAQKLALKNEELRTEVKAADLIFKTLYLSESLRLQEEIFKLKEEALKIVKDRYRDGRAPLQEVTKYEVDLSQQKNKLRLAEVDLKENESAVKASFVVGVKSKNWPFKNEENLALETREKNQPAVEQKYWELKSSEAAWQGVNRTYWPTLDFSIQYQETPFKSLIIKEVTSALVLSIPLWSKYETAASVSSAYADYLSADADYRSTERAATLRKEFLASKVESVRQNLIESKTNLDKSKLLYADILRAFKLGKVSTNDLLAEQSRLLGSESNLIEAQLSFHQTVVESCVLQGLRVKDCIR